MNPTPARAFLAALTITGGALVGDAAWSGAVQVSANEAPSGLTKRDMALPHHLRALIGELSDSPDAWSLAFHRALHPSPGSSWRGPSAISGVVSIPETGRLELWPAAIDTPDGVRGVAVVLERLAPPSTTVVQANNGAVTPLSCDQPLPPPDDEPIAIAVTPTGSSLVVQMGDTRATCAAQFPPAPPLIRSGLRRVQIADLTIAGTTLPPPGPTQRGSWWAAGAVAALLLAVGLLRRRWSRLATALTLAPLFLAGALTGFDLHAWAEAARVLWLPIPWLAAAIPTALTLTCVALGTWVRCCRESPSSEIRSWHWVAGAPMVIALMLLPASPLIILAGVVAVPAIGWGMARLLRFLGSTQEIRDAAVATGGAGLLTLLVGVTEPLGFLGLVYATLLGLSLGVLIWVNVNARRARAYNLTAFVAAAVALCTLEVVVRFTPAGESWAARRAHAGGIDILNEAKTVEDEFALFDEGKPSAYPFAGTPVAAPPPDGRVRVVAMGSSSTGGAYQNDRLSDFYPARMQEQLGTGFQVINQGVGGWTTFHIDRFATARMDELDPDVLTLYIGHNDQLTLLPRPISEIHAQMQVPGIGTQLSQTLGRFRLFAGLRYVMAGFRTADQRTAVPIPEARRHLTHLIEAAQSRNASVILASEGLNPDPGPLVPYFHMLASLARAHDNVRYIDTAAALHAPADRPLFLDDSHLTEAGHRRVARMLSEAVKDRMKLETHP